MKSDPQPTRKAGRPIGSRAKIVKEVRAIGVHHFAFVRSSLLGMDLAKAFERYLAWSEPTTDLRYVQNRREALLKQIIEEGRAYDASQQGHFKITDLLDLLRSDAAPAKAVVLPTLDEWLESEGMDPDGWSEADMLTEYKAHFGLDNADAIDAAANLKDPAGERVRALNHLETVISTIPKASDRLESWFAKPVAKKLHNVGLLTLADLMNFINVYGYRWYSGIKGFGVNRANQVLRWLDLEQEHLNMLISGSVRAPKSKLALNVSTLLPALLPTPTSLTQFGSGTSVSSELARIQVTPNLDGERGVFRSHMANSLDAKNDLEAVNQWLSGYQEKPHTHRSYRKEAERFLLWCARELKKPLSSVNSPDCQEYRAFLKSVPTSWINKATVKRTDPAWRAFRSQPSPASQKQALVILQALFGGLVDAGYLVANPLRQVMKNFDMPSSKTDLTRSFTESEWHHILRCLQGLPDGDERLRMRCILELLVTSGLRLDELANARHKDLRQEVLPDLPPSWVLTVTGKRKKVREVPLNSEVVRLLALHGGHFLKEDLENPDRDNLPLIRTLHSSVEQWGRGQGGVIVKKALSDKSGGALSNGGIYSSLKRFFKQAAKTAEAAGLDPRRFEKASTHWMRHTFVRQALVDGVPIEVASELAGHASIATTSIYSSQELSRKIKAINSMKQRTLPAD